MGKVIISSCVAAILLSASAFGSDTSVVESARNENWIAVAALIAEGADVNARDLDNNGALHWAVRADEMETTLALLAAGADASAANVHGVTPLYLSIQNANAPMMEVLLAAGADARQSDITGETALMIATQTGSVDAVRSLLAHGADVNASESNYQLTALMYAARDGYSDIVAVLIDNGADITARTRTGPTPEPRLPCINASGCGSHGLGIVRGGLPERGRWDPIPGAMTALMYAAREGHLEAVRPIVAAGSDVNQVDMNDISPLMLVISNNRVDVARYLIEKGADIHAEDSYGRTPLWSAVDMRNADLHYTTFETLVTPEERTELLTFTRELLEMGVDPNARLKEVAPLRSWLYLLGGTLSWVDFTGQTPFLLASLSGDVQTMRLLLEYDADPLIPTYEGTTALMAASGINWVVNQTYTEWDMLLEAVELCYDLGMDVNEVNSMGLTALMGAANRGSEDIIRFLAGKGARLDAKDNEGRDALAWAGGVFLATHSPEPKPDAMALLQELMGSTDVASSELPE